MKNKITHLMSKDTFGLYAYKIRMNQTYRKHAVLKIEGNLDRMKKINTITVNKNNIIVLNEIEEQNITTSKNIKIDIYRSKHTHKDHPHITQIRTYIYVIDNKIINPNDIIFKKKRNI